MKPLPPSDRVYKPGRVAELLNVDPKTVARYAQAGKLPHFRLPSGHRRFYADAIDALRQPVDSAPLADVAAILGETLGLAP